MFGKIYLISILTLSILTLATSGGSYAHADSGRADSGREGIWKAVVPPTPMQGEFAGLDPVGVAAGAIIQADCSLNWTNPDDGKRYCFSSGTSLQYFLDRPQANIARAQLNWPRLQADMRLARSRPQARNSL